MRYILSFLFIAAICHTARSETNLAVEVRAQVKAKTHIWLCDVDSSGSVFRYRAKQMIGTKTNSSPFSPGKFLPVDELKHKTDRIPDEALVFMAARPGSSGKYDRCVVYFYGGVSGDEKLTLSQATAIVKDELKKR